MQINFFLMQKEEEGDYIHVEHSNIPYMAVCFF